jgi:hypothetical protein
MKSIYELALGETTKIGTTDNWLIRVPGGWVMKIIEHDRGVCAALCFIPFDNEFQL